MAALALWPEMAALVANLRALTVLRERLTPEAPEGHQHRRRGRELLVAALQKPDAMLAVEALAAQQAEPSMETAS